MDATFASGRYSKRKRTQVNYVMEELDVSESEPEFEPVPAKKRKAGNTSKRQPRTKAFPFLKLPAEIRNMIYEIALTDPNGINLVSTFKHYRRTVERLSADGLEKIGAATRRYYGVTNQINNGIRAEAEAPRSLCPALLAVNKQLLQECREMLYSNKLVFVDTQALYSFLINIGPARTKSLKSIRLRGWGWGRGMKAYNHACFAALAGATKLEAFYIDAQTHWNMDPRSSGGQFYRDAFPWLEAYGAAHGKVDAAVEILKFDSEQFTRAVWRKGARVQLSLDQAAKEYTDVLRKHLFAQQKRVMAKTVKRRKTSASVASDEL